ncbi:MAG: cell envelope biogenesis protein TolA [Cystobacter sp.]
MVALLIIVSAAFLITLGLLLFRPASAPALAAPQATKARGELAESETKARARLEADLERKRKELDEQRTQLQEVKEQLKQAKRKNYDQRESEKGEKELARARVDVERNASLQLEVLRGELAQAESEIARLRSEQEMGRGGRRQPAVSAPAPIPPAQPISTPAQPDEPVVAVSTTVVPAAAVAAVVAPPEATAEKAPRRHRELNDVDREKMERLETTANKERTRAADLERELKRVRGRADSQQRIFSASKSELDLVKDKYKALEKRLNRTLLEKDLLRRAIKDLEKKTGILAERTELTPDEMAASDQKVEEATRARAAAEAAQQQAAAPAAPESAEPPAPVSAPEEKPATP